MTDKIISTKDYSAFKFIKGNRVPKPGHITRLQESYSEFPHLPKIDPIKVNEKLEIVDGQHRFEALKRLSMPIYYIESEGLTLEDVQILNSSTKTWGVMEYAKSFSAIGNKHYTKFLDVHASFPVKFSHKFLISSLSGGDGDSDMSKMFRRGKFKVKDDKNTIKVCKQLCDVAETNPEMKVKEFYVAFRRISLSGLYDHKRFLKKLKVVGELNAFRSTTDALREIERIYNYRSKDTVWFSGHESLVRA